MYLSLIPPDVFSFDFRNQRHDNPSVRVRVAAGPNVVEDDPARRGSEPLPPPPYTSNENYEHVC
jgi:hypothetical protein